MGDAGDFLDQQDHGTQVNSVAWSPSDCYVATAAQQSGGGQFDELRVWQVDQTSGEAKLVDSESDFNGSQVNAIDFSPDGCFFISVGPGNSGSGFDNNFTIWDFDESTGQIMSGPSDRQGREAFSVAFSPDGCFVAIGSNKNTGGGGAAETLIVYELNKQDGTFSSVVTELSTNDGTFEVRAVAWSPDGRYLASGDSTGDIHVWEFDAINLTLTEVTGSPYMHGTSVNALTYSPDGCFLASGAAAIDEEIKIWKVDKTTGQLIQILSINADHADVVNGLSWSYDGKQLSSAGGFGVDGFDVKIWSFDPVTPTLTFQTGYAQGVSADGDSAFSVAFSPTDCFFASGAEAPDVGTVSPQPDEGQLQTRSTGIIYPKESTIKRNEVSRVTGGCGGFGIQGGCNNLIINNQVYKADIAYIGVTNVYAKGLGGIPNAFDNISFPPTCTLAQCDHINRSGLPTGLKSPTKSALPSEQSTRSMPTRSPTSVSETAGATHIIRGVPFIIRKPGTYVLATSAQVSGGAAIIIASSDVALDLGGQTLVGEGLPLVGTELSYGVRTEDGFTYDNITIINGTINDMTGAGVYVKDVTNLSLKDLNILNCEAGIHVEGTPITDPDTDTPTSSHVFVGDARVGGNAKAAYLMTGISGLTFLNTLAESSGHDSVDPDRGGYVVSSCVNVAIETSIATTNVYGYYLSLIHDGSLRSCGAAFNTENGFHITGADPGSGMISSKRISLQQSKALNNKKKGIELNDCEQNSIVECECKNNIEEGIFVGANSNFNLVIKNFASSNGSYGIFDGSSIDIAPITTNRIFTNIAQNNAGAGPFSASVDVNYHNVPAIIQLQPVGGTALNAITNATSGALSNIST